MTNTLQLSSTRAASGAVLLGPLVAATGVALRPFVSNFLDPEAIVRLVSESPTRWVAGTAFIAAGFSLSAVGLIRSIGAAPPSDVTRSGRWAIPALVLGSAALAYQFGASGIGLYGTVRSNGDVLAYLEEAARWETPVLVIAIATLGFGWWATARLAVSSASFRGPSPKLTKTTALIAVAGFLIPSSIGEYVSLMGLAGLLWLVRPHHVDLPSTKEVTR